MKNPETIPCPDSRDPDKSGLSVGSNGVILVAFRSGLWYTSDTSKSGRISPLRLVESPVPSRDMEGLDEWLTKPPMDDNQVRKSAPSWRDTPRRKNACGGTVRPHDLWHVSSKQVYGRGALWGTPVSPSKTLKENAN